MIADVDDHFSCAQAVTTASTVVRNNDKVQEQVFALYCNHALSFHPYFLVSCVQVQQVTQKCKNLCRQLEKFRKLSIGM